MAGLFNYALFQSVILLLLPLWVSSAMGNLKTINYTQRLDHFNNQSNLYNSTFQQKLLINDSQWAGAKSGAPIFVILGGLSESEIPLYQFGVLSLGLVEFKAILVYIEHRFNGDSIPLGSIDLAMANHRVRACLATNQTLQDFAVIIQSLKANLSAHNSPVIVVGVGYGGALATWFRVKYPKIAIGALASSTPLLYYGSTTPARGYCHIVSNDFKDVDQTCYGLIRESWKIIDDIATHPNGLAELSQYFNTCRPLQSSEEVKQWLAQLYSATAQNDNANNNGIQYICQDLYTEKVPINGLVRTLYAHLPGGTCFNSTLIKVDSPFEPTTNSTAAWAWLRCSELIFPIGCVRNTMLPSRPFDMTQFKKSCQERFGIVPSPRSPINFSGSHNNTIESLLKFGENIIFSNGLKDPFSSGAILNDLSKTIIAITTSDGSYFMDMKAINDDDPNWLVEQRQEELKIFRRWIDNFHHINRGSNRTSCTLLIYLLGLLTFLYMYLSQ